MQLPSPRSFSRSYKVALREILFWLCHASSAPDERTSPCSPPFFFLFFSFSFLGRMIFSLTDELSYPTYNPYTYERMTDPTVIWRSNEAKTAFVLAGNYDSPDFVCHVDGSPASDFIEVNAGDSINLKWTKWPVSHIGPIITYIANAGGDFSKVDKVNLPFVKIEELGLIRNSTDKKNKPEGYYAANKLIDAGGQWTVTIPDYVAPGNYIVRHEIIALMGAVNIGHAQHYPQCINVKVTGNGKDPIASGTRAKDLYKATDPGIQIMIYKDLDYQIPGPKLYKPNDATPSVYVETQAAISSAPATPVPSAGVPSTTLISVPIRGGNATAFPSYHFKPSQTQAAATTPSSKPATISNTDKADEYTYDLSGLNGDESVTEEGAVKHDGAGQTDDATKSASPGQTEDVIKSTSTGQTKDIIKSASPGQTEDLIKSASTGQTGGQKTYDYSGLGQETKSTITPANDETSSSFSPEDFELPKGATVEQLIAFLEKLVNKLKAAVLNKKHRYARDFSMN